jgi:hypothetical protein
MNESTQGASAVKLSGRCGEYLAGLSRAVCRIGVRRCVLRDNGFSRRPLNPLFRLRGEEAAESRE